MVPSSFLRSGTKIPTLDFCYHCSISVLGMVLPPWYEEFAAPARAWHYTPSRFMLSHVPVWVIGAYGGCMFTIATMAWVFYRPQAWGRAVLGGIFTGAGLMFWGTFWFAW